MQRISVSFAIDVDADILSAFIRVIRVIRDSEAKTAQSRECLNGIHTRGMPKGIHTVDFLIWCNPRFRSKIRVIRVIRDSETPPRNPQFCTPKTLHTH